MLRQLKLITIYFCLASIGNRFTNTRIQNYRLSLVCDFSNIICLQNRRKQDIEELFAT